MSLASVAKARGMIGTRFRAQGRSADSGLDCVGLIIAAFGLPEQQIRRNYALRGGSIDECEAALSQWFAPVSGGDRPGDVWLVRPGAAQLHLVMLTETGFIHGDAGLGRIVEVPVRASWGPASRWRRGRDQWRP